MDNKFNIEALSELGHVANEAKRRLADEQIDKLKYELKHIQNNKNNLEEEVIKTVHMLVTFYDLLVKSVTKVTLTLVATFVVFDPIIAGYIAVPLLAQVIFNVSIPENFPISRHFPIKDFNFEDNVVTFLPSRKLDIFRVLSNYSTKEGIEAARLLGVELDAECPSVKQNFTFLQASNEQSIDCFLECDHLNQLELACSSYIHIKQGSVFERYTHGSENVFGAECGYPLSTLSPASVSISQFENFKNAYDEGRLKDAITEASLALGHLITECKPGFAFFCPYKFLPYEIAASNTVECLWLAGEVDDLALKCEFDFSYSKLSVE